MKKIFILITFLFLLLSLGLKVNASVNIQYLDSIKDVSTVSERDVNGVATLYQATYNTYNGGVKTKVDKHVTSWIEPNVSMLDNDLRIVAYSSGDAAMWKGCRPTDIAKRFEQDHPDWVVLGGINGDFFEIGDNCEPIGTFMQEGEFLKKSFIYIEDGAMGFRDDGTYIFGYMTCADKEAVQLLDSDGNYQTIGEINTIDNATISSGINLYTRFGVSQEKNKYVPISTNLPQDFSSSHVYKIHYSLQRYDRETDGIYVKGEVVEITTNTVTLKMDDKEQCSYLVSDTELSLKVGDTVRVTPVATGDWSKVTNIMGVFGHILENGNVLDHMDENNSYVNTAKNRTVVGFKEDGTPILMSIEMNSYGASYLECGEILKSVGCTNGCLLDGGGSACLFIRNKEGNFELINRQTDGSERRDGNALLLVERRPGFNIRTSEVKRSSFKVDLDINNQELFNSLSNIKVTVSREGESYTKDYNNTTLVFDNLLDNAAYNVEVSYTIPSFKKENTSITSSVSIGQKTQEFIIPDDDGLKISEIGKTTIKITRDLTLPRANEISNVVIYIGDFSFNLGSKEELVCGNLLSDQEYDIYYTYDVTDPETNRSYHVSTLDLYGSKKVTTLAYDLPVIEEFSFKDVADGKVNYTYKYTDSSKIVKNVKVYVNNEAVQELTNKRGTIKLTDDGKTTLKVKLVFECEYGGKSFTFESQVLEYKPEIVEPEPGKTDPEPEPSNPEPSNPEPEPSNSEPEPTKKKCGKKSAELILSLISLSTLLMFVIRKKH